MRTKSELRRLKRNKASGVNEQLTISQLEQEVDNLQEVRTAMQRSHSKQDLRSAITILDRAIKRRLAEIAEKSKEAVTSGCN